MQHLSNFFVVAAIAASTIASPIAAGSSSAAELVSRDDVLVQAVEVSGSSFNPSSLVASVGSEVQFQFVAHSSVQSSAGIGSCTPTGGINSGNITSGGTFTISIADSKPIFLVGGGDACFTGTINA